MRAFFRVATIVLVASICSQCDSQPDPKCDSKFAPHATYFSVYQTACNSGFECTMRCDHGWLDCNGLESDGCEVNGSSCSFCPAGFHDCNGSIADGCEHEGPCDVGAKDASAEADAAICGPATSLDDASTPRWIPPLTPSNVCSPQDISAFAQAFSSTDPTALDTWTKAHAACAACLVTPSNAPAYGALIDFGVLVQANIGGCVAIVSGDDPFGCGVKELENEVCTMNVCAQCQDFDAFVACTSDALTQQPCSSYATCSAPDSGALYGTCYSEKTFDDYISTLGALFCSNAVADASTD